jgi:hypothetical protein
VDWILTEIFVEVHPWGTTGVRVMFNICRHFLKNVQTHQNINQYMYFNR